MARKKVIIVGAAGRDFHNFNTYYRDNGEYEVVAFTATQIPDIHGRKYPPSLAGKLYPQGIPIFEEAKLAELIKKHGYITTHVFEANRSCIHSCEFCVAPAAWGWGAPRRIAPRRSRSRRCSIASSTRR